MSWTLLGSAHRPSRWAWQPSRGSGESIGFGVFGVRGVRPEVERYEAIFLGT